MSISSIEDFKVKIKPTAKLILFLSKLHACTDMPTNILKIYQSQVTNKDKKVKEILEDDISIQEYTEFDLNTITQIAKQPYNGNYLPQFIESQDKENQNLYPEEATKENSDTFLELKDIKWLNTILIKKNGEKKQYLHELLQGCEIILPKNKIIPRNPVLELRCKKLREEQEHREYKSITKDVDSVRKYIPEDTISYQIKSINRQLIAVAQFIFSVIAGFVFGFIGLDLIFGNLDFGFRLLLGIICSLVIALAEIYFLAKKLNEYDDVVNENTLSLDNKINGKTVEHNSKPHND